MQFEYYINTVVFFDGPAENILKILFVIYISDNGFPTLYPSSTNMGPTWVMFPSRGPPSCSWVKKIPLRSSSAAAQRC